MADMSARFIVGDVFDVMATLPDQSVDLVLTSPPFLALRSYLPPDHPDKGKEIGSEATPGAFIDTLLALTEEWARLLAPHGSLCVELGDTYSGSGGAGGDYNADGLRDGQEKFTGSGRLARYTDGRGNPDGMRDTTFSGANTRTGGGDGWPDAKSLCLIPELYRIALVYGFNPLTGRTTPRWRARNVVRWCRPNPPVGALGDKFRPATSEMVVACKSARRFFDLDAVRQPPLNGEAGKFRQNYTATNNNAWRGQTEGAQERVGLASHPAGAPPLDWWNIPTEPYAGSHYATWPTALLTRPIMAMCPAKVCRTCGKPSERITETTQLDTGRTTNGRKPRDRAESFAGTTYDKRTEAHVETLGFTDCGHEDNYRPGLVLDPFAGSGTTLAVATGHGRDAIGVDLDERNADLARERCGMFLEVDSSSRFFRDEVDVSTRGRT